MPKRAGKKQRWHSPRLRAQSDKTKQHDQNIDELTEQGGVQDELMAVAIEEVEPESDSDDNEVHHIDTSWIKKEPGDEEVRGMEEAGHGNAMKRKLRDRQAPDSDEAHKQDGTFSEPSTKYMKLSVKEEPVDGYMENQYMVNQVKLSEGNIKSEEEQQEEENVTEEDDDDEDWEEEGAVNVVEGLIRGSRLKIQRCAKCAIVFPHRPNALPSALQQLCKKCQPNVSITCKYCSKHFEHHKLYKKHASGCGTAGKFNCRKCHDSFLSEVKFRNHKCSVNLNSQLRYVCPICCEGFQKNKERNNHKTLHVDNGQIRCKRCKIYLKDVTEFQMHTDWHEVMRLFICTTCKMTFESRRLYDADQQRHRLKEGNSHSIARPPDYVFACKLCKHWFPTLSGFEAHKCLPINIFNGPGANDVHVARQYNFGTEDVKSVHQTEAPKHAEIVSTVKPCPLGASQSPVRLFPPSSEVPEAERDSLSNVLDSTFMCRLCNNSFKTAVALGFHACILQHSAFQSESDDEEEEEEEEEKEKEGDMTAHRTSEHRVQITQDPSDVHTVKPMSERACHEPINPPNQVSHPSKVLNYSDVENAMEPGTLSNALNSFDPHTGSKFLHFSMCMLCGRYTRHNFSPMFGSKSAKYLCSMCLKEMADRGRCSFRCSKCFQVFETLSRLHRHLPWHKEQSSQEGVFKKTRLAPRRLSSSERFLNGTSSPSNLSPGSSVVSDPVSDPAFFTTFKDQNIAGRQQQQQPKQDTTMLSALLNEPVDPLPGVKKLLRNKLLNPIGGNRDTTVNASGLKINQVSMVNTPGSNRVILSTPLVSPQPQTMLIPVFMKPRDSLLSSVGKGMFPPVFGTELVQMDTMAPLKKPRRELKMVSQMLAESRGVPSSGPAFLNHNGMLIKMTQNGPHGKTIQVMPPGSPALAQQQVTAVPVVPSVQTVTTVPAQSVVVPAPPMAAPNVVLLTAPQSLPSQSAKPPTTQIGTVEPKESQQIVTNDDDPSVSCPTSEATQRDTQIVITRHNSKIEKPVKISSIKRTGSSTAEVTLTPNGNKTLMTSEEGDAATAETSAPAEAAAAAHQAPRGFFLCYQCNRLFKDITALKQHGCQIQAFRCHLCNIMMDSPEELYKHKCGQRSFVCHMCSKKCNSAEELNQHPCIESRDIRIEGEGSIDDGAVPEGSMISEERGEEDDYGSDSSAGGELDGRQIALAAKNRSRNSSWEEMSKETKKSGDFMCYTCGANFNTSLSLYIHKIKHTVGKS